MISSLHGAQPVLEIKGLDYMYPESSTCAVSDIDISIAQGEFVLLTGPSAGGKSTILRAACGLIPHFHGGELAGSIAVIGRDVLSHGPAELADSVAYLGQNPELQVVSSTVDSEIGLALELRGASSIEVARGVEEVSLALGVGELRGRVTGELSGGELQRVALAASLSTRPSLLLLDEPTSQLDPVSGDELTWLLRRLNEEWGVTVVIAEHRVERFLPAVDRVISVSSGAVAFDGTPGEYTAWAAGNDPSRITPAARMFSLAGIDPLPVGVRDARMRIRQLGIDPVPITPGSGRDDRSTPTGGSGMGRNTVLSARDLWIALESGGEPHDVICGLDLQIRSGETVALMGRNGAGKSTLLRAAAGQVEPEHGRLNVSGPVSLLGQSPTDYLFAGQVADELPGEVGAEALRKVGLEGVADRDPRDLSGGQQQRLALAIALAGRRHEVPGLIALDEPTRGLDRALEEDLSDLCREFAAAGHAVVVATHDVEFAKDLADRVVLLGAGVVIADGPAVEVLSGGWYFATQVSRVLGIPGVVAPHDGARALVAAMNAMRMGEE